MYKTPLAREVDRHNHNLLIHGLKSSDLTKDVKALFGNLKTPKSFWSEVDFEAQTIGRESSRKVQSIIVRFTNPFERNTVLIHAKNLPKEVLLESDILL